MLVKITTVCRMCCSHCMEDAGPEGQHMTAEIFEKVIDFITRNNFVFLMISGGEPTEHPEFADFVKMARSAKLETIVLSNGMFLNNVHRDEYLSLGVKYQIINDPKYYPTKIDPVSHPNISVFDTKIMAPISPFGRALNMKAGRINPLCFNLRSATRQLRDFRDAVHFLRLNGKMCIPSITVEGDIVAGESRFCSKIGTVESSNIELTNRVVDLKCSKCGLVNNLDHRHRTAIGEL